MQKNLIMLLSAALAISICSNTIAQEQTIGQSVGQTIVQAAPPPIAPQSAPANSAPEIIPKGTPIIVEITQLISTKTAVRDDFFELKLVSPIVFQDRIIIPAGTKGSGQVVDAGKPQMGGASGQLVIAARYLIHDGQRIPIRGLKLNAVGQDKSVSAVGLSSVGTLAGPAGAFVGLMVTGGDMEVPAGTLASAKLGVDFVINSSNTANSNNGN